MYTRHAFVKLSGTCVLLAPALGSGDSQACQGKNGAPEGKGEISNEKKSRRPSKASGELRL